jgi:heme-degrading monooxygenase HmoA
MIAVIFEVFPQPEHKDAYLAAAAKMRPLAEGVDGFISVERFESLTTPGKLVSLSYWRDERALGAWRNLPEHRAMQKLGRATYFKDYRLRVAEVSRDYGMNDRDQVPEDSKIVHPPKL